MSANLNAPAAGAGWQSLDGEAFVRQAYQRLLDRPADPSGLRNYTAQLAAGMSKAQLMAELESSPEGRLVARRRSIAGGHRLAAAELPRAAESARPQPTPAVPGMPAHARELLALDGMAFVRHAYLAILGRDPDPSGLAHYSQRLASGVPKVQILADLRADPEGQAYASRLAGLDELLGKGAANKENQHSPHVNELLVLHGTAFVRAAYLAILRREADPGGLATYVALLRGGFSRTHVLDALACSPEARSRSADAGAGLRGLKTLLKAYRKGQARSWAGWYWRNVKGAESDLPPAREARRLAWRDEEN